MATSADTLKRTNEVPGTRAKLSNLGTSAYKVREVLNLIRGEDVHRALDILEFCERGPAEPIQKLLNSAIANAVENDAMDRDELFVSACFADEGVTAKRMRPRARGRSGRIRKRSSHITIIVSRLPEDRLERLRAEQAKQTSTRGRRVSSSRAARVAAGRKGQETAEEAKAEETDLEATEVETAEVEAPVETKAAEATTESTETSNEAAPEAQEKEEK